MSETPAGHREGHCLLAGTGDRRRLLLSPLTAIPRLAHAFTTRGSDAGRALAAEAGRPLPLFSLHQVHGGAVHAVEDRDALQPPGDRPHGDALITRRRGVGLQVRVADCVPILLCDPVSGWIGAVHAGWRGTLAGVAGAAIRALNARGARSADLFAALGPSIGPCCFEVGPEVARGFREAGGTSGTSVLEGSPARVDLIEANRRQVLREGVSEQRIATSGLCTACRPDLLESYRRSHGAPGRSAAVIAWTD